MARLGRRLDAVGRPGRPQDLAARPDEDDPAVVAAEAPPPHPGDLAERAELVEQPRLVAGDPRRQDVALEDGRRDRQPGQLVDDLGQPLEGGAAAQRRPGRAADRPARRPASRAGTAPSAGRVDRLDLAPQARQRATAEQAQDLRVAPLALGAARPELAAQERARREQPLERVLDDADRQAPARAGSGVRNGPWVRAQRASSPSSAATAGPRNASGTPTGGATPTPSR